MPESTMCPVCQRTMKLTVFGAIPKHTKSVVGEKNYSDVPCIGSGYTLEEAAMIFGHVGPETK